MAWRPTAAIPMAAAEENEPIYDGRSHKSPLARPVGPRTYNKVGAISGPYGAVGPGTVFGPAPRVARTTGYGKPAQDSITACGAP